MAIVERTYAVLGSSAAELGEAIALLGPLRGGRRYTAYTDWTLSWRASVGDPSAFAIELAGEIILPRWTPLRSVSPELVARWRRLVDALRLHESGHVAVAERARAELRDAIDAAATATPESVRALAEQIRRRAFLDEAAYDLETDHGATQGASAATLFG